jgi:hypothetical protein
MSKDSKAIWTHRDEKRERDSEREGERQKKREMERERHGETEKEKDRERKSEKDNKAMSLSCPNINVELMSSNPKTNCPSKHCIAHFPCTLAFIVKF